MDIQLIELLQKLDQKLDVIQLSLEQVDDRLAKIEANMSLEFVIDPDFNLGETN